MFIHFLIHLPISPSDLLIGLFTWEQPMNFDTQSTLRWL